MFGSVRGLVICASIALAPLVGLQLFNLYRYRPHYEFAPFLIVIACLLLKKRWPRQPAAISSAAGGLAWSMIGAGAICLMTGVIFYSPWLGTLAALVTSGGIIILTAGTKHWRELLPVWCLFWLTLPPPFLLDGHLVQILQSLTSEGSSLVLNWMGVLHMRAGNVFRLPEQTLFVAEACSGIHSQLVLIAVAALMCVMTRRSIIHTLLLMTSAIVWSVLANIARATLVVWGVSHGYQLADGAAHETLGFGLVFAGFVGLWSTDQLLKLILGPLPLMSHSDEDYAGDIVEETTATRIDAWFGQAWNRWVSGLHPVDEAGAPEMHARPVECSRLAAVVSLLFLASCALQLFMLCATPSPKEVHGEAFFARTGESDMPSELGMLKRTDYLTETRDRSSAEGQYSHVWIYGGAGSTVRYSMDFPFTGWHELSDCYVGQGWNVTSRLTHEDFEGNVYVASQLQKPTGDRALLCFSIHRADGTVMAADGRVIGIRQKLATNPLISAIQGRQVVPVGDTTVQFQQLVPLSPTGGDEEIRQLRLAFESARTEWHRSVFAEQVHGGGGS